MQPLTNQVDLHYTKINIQKIQYYIKCVTINHYYILLLILHTMLQNLSI